MFLFLLLDPSTNLKESFKYIKLTRHLMNFLLSSTFRILADINQTIRYLLVTLKLSGIGRRIGIKTKVKANGHHLVPGFYSLPFNVLICKCIENSVI